MTFLLCWAATAEETAETERSHATKVVETQVSHLNWHPIYVYLLQEMDHKINAVKVLHFMPTFLYPVMAEETSRVKQPKDSAGFPNTV